MIPVFILTFNGIQELNKWLDPKDIPQDIKIHIIDNGRQKIPDKLKPYVTHTTEYNIFCAGGWNLSCLIGFDYFGYDKIIITQDDLIFDYNSCRTCDSLVTPDMIVSSRNDYWFYTFFGLHKETFKTVGMFDENYLYVTCEDNDFHYRSLLKGIKHGSFQVHMPNLHLTSKEFSYKFGNYEYLISKWGKEQAWGKYTYTTPFDSKDHPKFRDEYWLHFPGVPKTDFMSIQEYNKFIKTK